MSGMYERKGMSGRGMRTLLLACPFFLTTSASAVGTGFLNCQYFAADHPGLRISEFYCTACTTTGLRYSSMYKHKYKYKQQETSYYQLFLSCSSRQLCGRGGGVTENAYITHSLAHPTGMC